MGTPSSPIRNTLKIFLPNKFWIKILKKKIVTENLKKKKKDWKNILCFLTLMSVFLHLLHICLCYAFLLIFICFAGLCFYSPFIFFIYFSTCLSLPLVLIHSLEVGKVVNQKPSNKTSQQNVWRWKKDWKKINK